MSSTATGPLHSVVPSTDQDVRLTLKPTTGGDAGHVDGAWWPRSRDLVAEVHALLRAGITRTDGRLERVSYRLADWNPAPRRMAVGSSFVRLAGYGRMPADTANLLVDGRWLVLLVVPPQTAERSARRTLDSAGASGNVDAVAELLVEPAATAVVTDSERPGGVTA